MSQENKPPFPVAERAPSVWVDSVFENATSLLESTESPLSLLVLLHKGNRGYVRRTRRHVTIAQRHKKSHIR